MLVKPPVGFPVSATTIAEFDTATTRAVMLIGFEQFTFPCAFSCTSEPIVGFAGIAEKFGR